MRPTAWTLSYWLSRMDDDITMTNSALQPAHCIHQRLLDEGWIPEVFGAPNFGPLRWPSSLPRLWTRREHDISEVQVKVVFPSITQFLKKTCLNQKQQTSPRLKAKKKHFCTILPKVQYPGESFFLLFSCPEQLLKSSCRSVRPSVRRSVRPSTFVKKWSLEYQKVIKTHLCTYLRDSSYSSYSSDRSDSRDSSDSRARTILAISRRFLAYFGLFWTI